MDLRGGMEVLLRSCDVTLDEMLDIIHRNKFKLNSYSTEPNKLTVYCYKLL